jgi:molecular chaperone HtpG
VIKLKDDALEFVNPDRIRQIIKTHSDYIPYPIYLNDDDEQINRQKAIWREQPREVGEDDYQEFYRQLTLEFDPPLDKIHFVADAPLMIYALLYFPGKLDRGLFTLREQDGLKLYARKVLIDEYSKDLLPPYLRFIHGVVDAEDLPLNVSRESVQASGLINRIQRILTNQVIQKLVNLANNDAETYLKFWSEYGQFIKEGIAADDDNKGDLASLLRFRSTTSPDQWISLNDYLERLKPDQDRIYYILGDDQQTLTRSPHLDYFQTNCFDVLILTDPVDSFMLLGLKEYQDFQLQNVADSDLELPVPADQDTGKDEQKSSLADEPLKSLIDQFKNVLGDRVVDVRETDRLNNSVARLVDSEGSLGQEIQRVYKMMDREYQLPKKVLEINPSHPLIHKLNALGDGQEMSSMVIEQIFDSLLLVEGIHPDPAAMIPRIQEFMDQAMKDK